MTQRLWFKLTSAFAFVIIVGILATVLVVRQGAASQFAHLMVNNHMVQPENLLRLLVDYYTGQGSWAHIDQHLPALVEQASDGVMSGMMGSMMGMTDNHLRIVDAHGVVVADSADATHKAHPPNTPLEGWSIIVAGQSVGELFVDGTMMRANSTASNSLLSRLTRAVFIAGIVAGLVALVLAGVLVRQITWPLTALTKASKRIATGDLQVRVPVHSHDELGELAATFNQMAGSLETQERLRSNLIIDVAHELRTPLTGIQGTVEAMQDGVFPMTTENLAAIHEQVMLAAARIALANAEAGQIRLDLTALNLAELCQNQVALFQPQAVQQQIHLTLHQADNVPLIQGDNQRLGQVLNNLLSNALRHTPAGGTVALTLAANTTGINLHVTDSGEGIAATDLPHVFDRFYRADHSRTRQTGGSGLGLAIARQLVEAHGGKIWAESPPAGASKGSRFTIFLPLPTV
jgi:signal transduction histidine kinase